MVEFSVSGGQISSVMSTPVKAGSGYAANSTIFLQVTGGGGSQGVVQATTDDSGRVAAFASVPFQAGTGYAASSSATTVLIRPMGVRIFLTVLGFALALGGFLYPVMRYLVRAGTDRVAAEHQIWPTVRRMLVGAGLSGVALIVTWGTVQPVVIYAAKIVEDEHKRDLHPGVDVKDLSTAARETTQMWSAIGAILFSILAALFSDWIGRRVSYLILCILALASVLYCYQVEHVYGFGFLLAVFLMGGLCSTFYGWLPLYLPELFRTTVRATGQGFCYNFGRILAAIFSLQIGDLYKLMESAPGAGDGQAAVCTVIGLVYIVGMGIIWLAPETKGRPLPD